MSDSKQNYEPLVINGVEFVSIEEACRICHCNRVKISQAGAAGHFARVRPGKHVLYSRPDLEKWLASKIKPAKPAQEAQP